MAPSRLDSMVEDEEGDEEEHLARLDSPGEAGDGGGRDGGAVDRELELGFRIGRRAEREREQVRGASLSASASGGSAAWRQEEGVGSMARSTVEKKERGEDDRRVPLSGF